MRLLAALALLIGIVASPLSAEEPQDARALIEAAVAAHGGDLWLEPGTLMLSGEAVFYAPDGVTPRSRADEYRMWREMGPDRSSAHGADGKVRIIAKSGDKVLFEVGYDGETTWTERGITPKEEADAFWASNFGFGIIRSALKDGFTLQRAPDRTVDGHPVEMVRIVDPQGQPTLFGFDKESRFIRYLGFRTPRGWHERTYDDFVRLPNGWVQAREVTLFYDGVMANRVFWTETVVGAPIDPALFSAP